MALKFPSDEWIKALSSQLNASEAYEKSAKDWEGDFIFIVEPDDAHANTDYLYLGLYHGKSPDAAIVDSEDAREAEFVLRAPYTNWRKVIEGKMDPIQGMMTRNTTRTDSRRRRGRGRDTSQRRLPRRRR